LVPPRVSVTPAQEVQVLSATFPAVSKLTVAVGLYSRNSITQMPFPGAAELVTVMLVAPEVLLRT
jgi:hypothetical protein